MMKIRKSIGSAVLAVGASLLFTVLAGLSSEQARAGDMGKAVKNSVLRISNSDIGKSRNLNIGPGKAVVLELPVDVRDVLIAAPETMDAVVHTSRRVYLIGKKIGSTTAVFFDANGKRILTLDIEVKVSNYHNLQAIFKKLMPGSDIKIESIGKTVLLTGSVRTPVEASRASAIAKSYFAEFAETTDAAKGTVSIGGSSAKINVINMLAVGSREQVMLKVQVVEMNREIIKQLGVDLAAVTRTGNMALSMLSSTPLSALGKNLFAGGFAGGVPMANGGLLTSSTKNFGISAMLKAMERNGMTRTLSEPSLTAVSGETAKFHVGGEFPIPISSKDGEITVEWKKFGVLLNFTPVVLSEGRISLQIKSEVSEMSQEGAISLGNITLPAIATRNAESTVELPSGGSMMMAGLISQKTRQAINGLPGLKNLPVLGALFRSRDFVKQETELVILVTPYVVKPVSANKLVTPDAGYAEASDAKGNLLGHLNRVYGRRGRMPKGRQHGDYGFIVE